jgi:hypothetical protein
MTRALYHKSVLIGEAYIQESITISNTNHFEDIFIAPCWRSWRSWRSWWSTAGGAARPICMAVEENEPSTATDERDAKTEAKVVQHGHRHRFELAPSVKTDDRTLVGDLIVKPRPSSGCRTGPACAPYLVKSLNMSRSRATSQRSALVERSTHACFII